MLLKKLTILTILIMLLMPFSWHLNAQENNTINSQILDKGTKEAVLFATIRLKNAQVGTIADEDGYFRIPRKYRIANDTLLISSIGFKNKEVPLRFLNEKKINIILLEPTVEALSEVVLFGNKKKKKSTSSISPENIVKKAIANIPLNYPKRPHSYATYYRDYQIEKDEYVNLNEALIEIFDGGFQTSQYNDNANQAKIFQYKRNLDFRVDSTTAIAYDNRRKKYIENARLSAFGGNELSILNAHNPIRNFTINTFSAVNTLKDNFTTHHFFSLLGIVRLDDISLYRIKFITRDELFGATFYAEGELYIEQENYAIHKFEYAGFRQKKLEVYNTRVPKYSRSKDPFFTVKLEYSRLGNTMYLNYISFNNIFKIRSRKDFKVNDIVFNDTENTITFSFNNSLNIESALRLKNYKLTYKKKTLKIKEVELRSPKSVRLLLEENDLPKAAKKESNTILNNVKLSFNNIVPASINSANTKVENLIYEKDENVFIIRFNTILNPVTAPRTKNYELSFKDQTISIKNIELLDKNTIKIIVGTNSILDKIKNEKSSDELIGLDYKLNNIKDTNGRKIGKITRKTVDQFRELFVQKVFPSKELPRSFFFMKKTTPISENRVLNIEDDNLYWINSPLKIKKGKAKKRKK